MSGGGLLSKSLLDLYLYDRREINMTTGKSNVTLNSLIIVAVSPVSSDKVKPAPITWATS